MIITPNSAYKDIGMEVYMNGRRIDRCTMVDTDRKIVRQRRMNPDGTYTSFREIGPLYEDMHGDLEFKLILYEDGTKDKVKEIITDPEQIEAALILDKLSR